MNMIKFSIIIPLYNKELHIARAVNSVLRQSIQDFELVIVDDGSTDDSANVVNSLYDFRITLIQQANAGVSVARNVGINASNYEYIAFLDADDEWLPNHLSTLSNLFEKYPDAGLYATNYQIYLESGKKCFPTLRNIPESPWSGYLPSYFLTAALGDPPVCASAVSIPRKVFDEVGQFVQGKRMGEDLDMWGRIALIKSVVYTRDSTAIYHQEASNRACKSFYSNDDVPFVETCASLNNETVKEDSFKDVILYLNRLKLENARENVLNGNYARARVLITHSTIASFPLRGVLWGTRINVFSALAWKMKKYFLQGFRWLY